MKNRTSRALSSIVYVVGLICVACPLAIDKVCPPEKQGIVENLGAAAEQGSLDALAVEREQEPVCAEGSRAGRTDAAEPSDPNRPGDTGAAGLSDSRVLGGDKDPVPSYASDASTAILLAVSWCALGSLAFLAATFVIRSLRRK